jgi:nicotinate-nucleotide--dimethylbenzimidazole phosphoribosyltransferase
VSTPPIDLDVLGADVEWPDHEAATQTRESASASLGRVAEIAEWLSGVQGVAPPRRSARVRVVVFGRNAGAGVDELAAELEASVRYVDDGIPADLGEALAAGVAIADYEIDSGADLFIAAYPDESVAAAVAVSVLTNTEPAKVLARGAAATDPGAWMDRAADVRDARRHAIEFRRRPSELLTALNRPMLAAATGFVLHAAARRTPVVLDGPAITAAALTAYEAQPRAVRWWWAADTTQDPAHALALTTMGMRSVLDLGLGLNDGTAGLLALPVLRAAGRLVREADSDS